MPSPELLKCRSRGAEAADRMGVTRGVLDLEGYRAAVGPTPFALPPQTTIAEAVADGVPCKWISAPAAREHIRVLYLHGGGYVTGGWRSHVGIAAWISHEAGCSVLLPEYRLAPENPFPAAVEDAVATWQWLGRCVSDGPYRSTHDFVVGDSAGGGLALAMMISLRTRRIPLPEAAVLLSPFVNLDPGSSKRLAESGFERGLSRAYLRSHDPRDPLASPIFADLAGLPPLLMQVSDSDPLAEDALELARKAATAGVDTTVQVSTGLPHVWHKFVPDVPEARDAVAAIGRYIRMRVEGSAESELARGGHD